MNPRDVKKNLLDHSAIKVRLLGEYLKRYLSIISNDGYTERIKIYDLFCGEGIYENGGEGSPLVILRAVKDIHFRNSTKTKKTFIDCQFNDIDEVKVSKVKEAITSKSLYYPSFGELTFSSNDYRNEVERLNNLLPKLRNQKAFIFIDPYGYKSIKAGDIKNLLSKDNSEVLLFLPTQFMYRFRANGTPEALKDFMEELSIEFKDWRKESASEWDYIEQLKNGFRKYLSRYFVDTFTIQKDPSTIFCLFFFSSHIRGFEKMLEAKWEIDNEQGKGWNYSGNQPTLFSEHKTLPIEEKLRKYVTDANPTNGEIYEFTLRSGFLPTHATEIFVNWQRNGTLEVFSPIGSKTRNRSFYISYDNYKNQPSKVKFRIR